MENESPEKGLEQNLDMNIRILNKEVIFSIDSRVFSDELYSIIGNSLGRFNAERNSIFFYLFKDSKDYPQRAMRIKKMNYVVKEAGDIVWVRLDIPSLANREINNLLEGRAFSDIPNALIYPFVIMREGRVYFIVQYDINVEGEISERLLSLNDIYNSKFWQNAFKIEYIDSSRTIPEILDSFSVDKRFKIVSIVMKRRNKPTSIFKDVGQHIPRWPALLDGSLTTMHLEDMLNYVDGPEEAIREFFEKFVRKSISALYMETYFTENELKFIAFIEDDLLEGMIDNLYDSIKKNLELRIESITEIGDKNIENKRDEYLNREFFKRQVIFSVDISKAYPEFTGIMSSGIAYYDSKYRRYYYSIMKSESQYSDQKIRLRKREGIMKEDEDILWISFDNVIYSNINMGTMMEGKTLSDMENVILYPISIVREGRLYHICQYNESSAGEVSRRIIALSAAYNRNIGRHSFIIHEMKYSEEISELISRFWDGGKVRKIEIEIPSEIEAQGIQKNHSQDLENVNFTVKMAGNTGTLNINDLLSGLGIPPEIMVESMRDIINNYIIALYFEASCGNGKCSIKWLYEERYIIHVLKTLANINKKGKYISIINIGKMKGI
jgi:hypothetical protein